jgi:hypothetical protein
VWRHQLQGSGLRGLLYLLDGIFFFVGLYHGGVLIEEVVTIIFIILGRLVDRLRDKHLELPEIMDRNCRNCIYGVG